MVNYATFDFQCCVFNIQVHVFGFVRHPSAIHRERASRAQLISTPIPTVAVEMNPPVEWSRENHPTLDGRIFVLFNMAVAGSRT